MQKRSPKQIDCKTKGILLLLSISLVFVAFSPVKSNIEEASASIDELVGKNSQSKSCSSGLKAQVNVQKLATSTTVRLLTLNNVGVVVTSGSGVIVQRQVNQHTSVYTVLTNLHVLQFAERYVIMTPDGLRHSPLAISRSVQFGFGDSDMAIAQFQSSQQYDVTQIKREPLQIGDCVFAAGFPIYQDRSLITTFNLGIKAFRFTEGNVLILPIKSLAQGYQLGYSNDIVVGMSGGPIFDEFGFLVGINGRIKNRDPDFGGYTFDDGTEPSPILLQQMLKASWGVPISTYLQFTSIHSHRIGGA